MLGDNFLAYLTLALGAALALGTGLALAKPQAVTSLVRTAGVDIIILQDGSASMHVSDVRGNRWQRSMRFLRTLGEALRWENDRIAMALFAHMATPQIRLTKDPNTYFFFLDHLEDRPLRVAGGVEPVRPAGIAARKMAAGSFAMARG